jgi:serine/threonine-protein kinase
MLMTKDDHAERNLLRFQREIELSRRLEHPRIAAGYEAGHWGRIPFLAMEYIPGPTLYQLVKRTGPLDLAWACLWTADVADALDYAHQGGVIHRDLKPSNIIVNPQRTAKLLDLGLARMFDDDHNEELVLGGRKIVGSFDYMAPEQSINSARADARSDIYALGCMLYFLLAGHPPFHHVSERRQKMECHRRVQPSPITVARPDCPVGLSRIVHRMLEKDPQARFSVAAEVRDALRDWADRVTDGDLAPELPNAWFGEPPVHLVRWKQTPKKDESDRGILGILGTGIQRLMGRKSSS